MRTALTKKNSMPIMSTPSTSSKVKDVQIFNNKSQLMKQNPQSCSQNSIKISHPLNTTQLHSNSNIFSRKYYISRTILPPIDIIKEQQPQKNQSIFEISKNISLKSNQNGSQQKLVRRNTIQYKPQSEMSEEDQLLPNENKTQFYDIDQGISFEVKSLYDKIYLKENINLTLPVMISLKTLNQTQNPRIEQISSSQNSFKQRANIDLICVIDTSGSMQGEKMQKVKLALLRIVDTLSENDRLSIILFNTFPILLCNLTRLTDINKEKISDQIKYIRTDGLTDIHGAMTLAFQILKNRKTINQISSIFMLSDGQDNQADEQIRKILATRNQPLQSDNFTIHSFGFGKDHDGEQMIRISDLKDGSYYFVDNIQQIDEFLFDTLGGLFSVIAKNLKIEINLNKNDERYQQLFKNAMISQTYGNMMKNILKNDSYTIELNQLFSGIEKNFIFEITIPCNNVDNIQKVENQSVQLLSVKLSAVSINNDFDEIEKQKDLSLNVGCFNLTENQINVDQEVDFHYFRMQISEQITEAINFADKKAFEKCLCLLQSMIMAIQQSRQPINERCPLLKQILVYFLDSVKQKTYDAQTKYKILSKRASIIKETSLGSGLEIYQNSTQKQLISYLKQLKKRPSF